MIRTKLSRLFYFLISLTLLLSPIPVSAIIQDLRVSDETEMIMNQFDMSYMYLDKKLSNIISELSELDCDKNSSLSQLHNHISQGFSVAHRDNIAAALARAELILQQHYHQLNHVKAKRLLIDFEDVIYKFTHELLTINTADNIDENIKRVWTNYIKVLGLLSVNDQIVQNITAVDLSVTDANIQNATITTLSATDEFVQNMSLTNLSVVEETVTGTLSANDVVIDTYLRFTDTAGGEYVGIQAPGTVPASYTLSLPTTSPVASQLLRANAITPTNLEWATDNAFVVPANSKMIYVTKYGNDTTGDGSFATPYASLSKAITTANSIASSVNPIAIIIGAGIYAENNSVGALSVTAEGISIVGTSPSSTIVMPNTPANDLLTIGSTIRIANVTFQSSSPLATGVSLTAGSLTVLNNVRVFNFLTGVSCSGGSTESYGFTTCFFVNNGTALSVSNTRVESNNCSIFGTSSMAGPAANTGFSVTGSSSSVVFSGGVIGLCSTGVEVTNNAFTTITGVNFRINAFDIVQSGASRLTASGCTFELTDSASDIDVQVDGAGTIAEIISCEFTGASIGGSTQGTGIVVTDSGVANISGGVMHNYTTALQVGGVSDTSSTAVAASGLIIRACTTDILQQGTTTLLFDACTASSSAMTINDATNVELSFFDLDDNGALTIGSTADQDTGLIQIDIDLANHPGINYLSSLYSAQAVGFNNTFGAPSSLYSLSADNTGLVSITTDRTKIAGLRLVSDTDSSVGDTAALRGWDINKNSSAAELSFTYQNSDVVGQSAVAPYVVMQLDGVNNQLQLPTAGTQILFAGDTNLYRNAANVLKTDDNFIVGTLTPSRAVVTDGSNQLASSTTTATEIGYVSGVTSAIQTQIDGKVSKSGDTMTGTLIMPAGSAALPSIKFTGSTNTGFSAATANTLSFDTNGTERMNIDGSGNVTVNGFGTAGVVHNNSSGLLSSSLIVNADITNATIANAKLATISSSNTAGSIVVRDGSGNFSTNMITLVGTVTNNTDAATKAYVDSAVSTGLIAKTPAEAVSASNQTLSGYPTIDGVSFPTGSDRVLLTGQTDPVENGLWVVAAGAWSRPADFNTGDTAGQAYVLILQGTTFGGSAWLCNTPTAVIGTDPINFALFSLPDTTTGANVGSGTGLIFRNKTGNTINFKSLLEGTHFVITNNADDITLATDATSTNTASTIVARDASGNFSAGTITANVTGSASNNVLKAGDTMTGTLIMPAGSAASPSIKFTGSTNTGFSAATANVLSFDINGSEQMNISSSGVTIDGFSTAGVVHNNSAGLLSSSLIVNADVSTSAAIVDTKLATISTVGKVANSATTATSANTPSTIVLRDSSGNFNAGTISASLTGAASLNVLKAGDTMTGVLQLPAGTTANPSLIFTGSTTTGLSASSSALSLSTSGSERLKIASGGTISVNGFTSSGVVHNDASGNLSSSLIVNADVSATAAIIDTKLATISTAGKVANSATTATSADTASAIVARDGSGNFSTNMITIDGTVTNPTDVATKAYVDSVGSAITGANVGAGTGLIFRNKTGSTLNFKSLIQGSHITITNNANDITLATDGTNLNTASTLVARDAAGNFSASIVSVTDSVASGNLVLSTEPSTSTAGNVIKGSSRFIHDFGTNNTFVGIGAGNFTLTGTQNSGFGKNALMALTSGSGNTAIGYNTLPVTTSGSNNTVVGDAMIANTTGSNNTALGANTLNANITGTDNTAVGYNALAANTDSEITAVGSGAMASYIGGSGGQNVAVGFNALNANVGGNSSTAVGWEALALDVTTSLGNNTAVGWATLNANTTGSDNTAIGNGAMFLNTTGIQNTAVGSFALYSNTTGINNTVVGYNALANNTPGNDNTAIGYNALTNSSVSFNTAVGSNALASNTTGSINTAVGYNALTANTTGIDNTAVGHSALSTSTIGVENTAVGKSALAGNTTGRDNTAVGFHALLSNTTGILNVAVGDNALDANTTGQNNVAVGSNALGSNTGGQDNQAMGSQALFTNTVGGRNTAIGSSALFANTTGFRNMAIGRFALGNNTTGSFNIAIGDSALSANTTGNNNVGIGDTTGATGSENVVIGANAGSQGNRNVGIGFSALVQNNADHNIAIGYNAMSSVGLTGGDNTAVGHEVMLSNTIGTLNVAVGSQALKSNTAGSNNIAVGGGSLGSNTTGTGNVAVGYNSLNANTLGINNTAMGQNALAANTEGNDNIAIGDSALIANITGASNVAIGNGTLANNITTSNNVAVGTYALNVNTVGGNTAVGWGALSSNTTGIGNVAIGYSALVINTIGTNNTALGYNALAINTTGTDNTAIGFNTLAANATGTSNNTAVGSSALAANTTGTFNTAVGKGTLAANTVGINNTALGNNALLVSTTGTDNTAIGFNALAANATGTSNNTAVGSSALAANTTGTFNTAMGKSALAANTVGTNNTAVGRNALLVSTTGTDNTAIGFNALAANATGTSNNTAVGSSALAANTTGANNTAVGQNALAANTTGTLNTAMGKSALAANTVGINNTALGNNALLVSTTGTDNTAIGFNALAANATGTSNNTAVGSSALAANTTGTFNTAVGKSALAANTVGTNNTAVGRNALLVSTTGTDNTAIGFNALAANATGTSNNTAVGSNSLAANTTGTNNTAMGKSALATNTIGTNNTAVGTNTLLNNTTGASNTALGYIALQNNTIGTNNTAVGNGALAANTTGVNNTACGSGALAVSTIGFQNVAVGLNSLSANTTGFNNTAVGFTALTANTTGTDNTGLGQGALGAVTTGTNNIAIGSSAGGTLTTGSGNIYINASAAAAAEATTTRIGTSQTRAFIAGIRGRTTGVADAIAVLIDSTGQLGTVSSSEKVKHNIQDMNDESAHIYQLRPVTFAYNSDETETKQYGLIAEEVDKVLPEIVVTDNDGNPETVQYHVLPVLLLNEIKKQQSTIENLTITTENMNAAINSLQEQLQQFMQRVLVLENNV